MLRILEVVGAKFVSVVTSLRLQSSRYWRELVVIHFSCFYVHVDL